MAAHGPHMAAFGRPWGSICLLRGSVLLPIGCFWVPLGMHVAAHGLQQAAHGGPYGCSEAADQLHFLAQGLSMAPMLQICSICCIWLGLAGVQDGREDGQLRANGDSGAPIPRLKAEIYHNAGSRLKDAHEL